MRKQKENLLDGLEQSYRRWAELYEKGGQDPFYPDGINLNLVRNHIIYYKRQIEETDPALMDSPWYRMDLPPEVESTYMARAQEIRDSAKKALAVYEHDENYLYLVRHHRELTPEDGKKTGVRSVLHYVSSLRDAIERDDLVTMRRYEKPEEHLDSFRSCAEKVKTCLADAEPNLFALADDNYIQISM